MWQNALFNGEDFAGNIVAVCRKHILHRHVDNLVVGEQFDLGICLGRTRAEFLVVQVLSGNL
jgi:hypothetical protein